MMKIGVLISGGGTNLQAVIDAVHGKSGDIAVVISNKADAYGLERAQKADIPTSVILESDCADVDDFNKKMVGVLKDYGVELVVLAGFMRILTPAFIAAYPNRIVNIHPALIPSFCGEGFYGMRVHRAIFEYGAKVSGPTVHFVNEEADGGPIIAQKAVSIDDCDSPEAIAQTVLREEHKLLPWVVEQICLGRVHVDGRRVTIDKA